MNFLQLNFSQRIWLGFGIIILLLSVSSILSLFNLNDINDSTVQVNENAVPVLKQSNQAQISLLKQAKLSSSGYTAVNELQIQQFSQQFSEVAESFKSQYQTLKDTVEIDQEMKSYVDEAGQHYQTYKNAVNSMFEAKQTLLKAKYSANEELRHLSNLVDDAGAFLLDVVWTEYGDDDEKRDIMEGAQGRLDGLIIGLYNVVDEINRSENLEYLTGAKASINDALSGIKVRNDHAETLMGDLRGRETWTAYLKKLEEFKSRATGEQSISDLKIVQLEQTKKAREQLTLSDEAIQRIVSEFDKLLLAADSLFNEKQQTVLDTVGLGSRSALIAWLILIIMASQNFNSMRKSIKKKMADLAKLNSTGETLASLLDKNKALEEVMASMHDQTGVSQGSVYLTNDDEKLEVKAFYPPKTIDVDAKPTQFSLGEGIIGRAAKEKSIIFVPNTHNDSNFVSGSDAPAKALLCVPLVDKDVLIGVMNFSGDVKQVSFEDSDYEFASSIARLLVTTIKNIRMRETIEEQNRTLEEKVKLRTAELRQKNKDIAVMMANLHQGLFTIMDGGVIHPEYSKYLESILDTTHIANRNFMDLIFADTNLGADATNQVATAVDSLLGMDEMMFDFNSHLLVNEVVMNRKDKSQVILELDWVPIVDQDTDEIEKILVTVRDVTELRALQLEAEAQKKELEIIGQILAISATKFHDFLNTSIQFIQDCRELITNTDKKDLDVIALLFRNMHTVKGNARTYGLKYVTDSVHQVEHTYDELRKDQKKEWNQEVLLEELALAESDILNYQKVANDKLGDLLTGSASSITIDDKKIQALIQQSVGLELSNTKPPITNWIQSAYDALASTQAEPVSQVLASVIDSVNSLAVELGKELPKVAINDGAILVKREVHHLLNNVFMHVFRNAMDHGIEKPEIRLSKGKTEQGKINFNTLEKSTKVIFEINDDGKGLAIEKIFQSAVEAGLYTNESERPNAQEIANLVFHSGLSTAEEVTEISGRGVGMDAVKKFLEEKGGSIEIILTGDNDRDEFQPFMTRLTIGSEHFIPKTLDK